MALSDKFTFFADSFASACKAPSQLLLNYVLLHPAMQQSVVMPMPSHPCIHAAMQLALLLFLGTFVVFNMAT